jgi:type IV pilus assembly protein PilM
MSAMFRTKTPIGVDIGSHSIKVVQLRQSGDHFELEHFGVAEIYPNGEHPGDAREQQAAKIGALKRALEKSGIKTKQSVSAVCGESIIVRYLQLPEMPEDELKKALQWEAEEYIPFRLTEVNIDSMILGKVPDADHPKMDVLLVSAKKDLVEQHVQILRGAGLEPKIVDVDSFAFLNCYETNHRPAAGECVALVNIGGEITSINIFNNGVSRFSRDIMFGGETMTTAIKSRLGCSNSEAERLKISVGAGTLAPTRKPDDTLTGGLMNNLFETVESLSGEEETPEAVAAQSIQNILVNLFSEVRRSLEFFESQYRGLNVVRVVLGGGTAQLKNLTGQFEAELQLPVELIDPLRRVKLSPKAGDPEQLHAIRHQLGVGIGLGLRGLVAA